MQFSESWLRSICNPALTTDELCHVLTMAGLEVEEVRPVAPHFDQVVIAQVLVVERHPDADRLNLCQVSIGQAAPLQIVCGAPNVRVGIKVPCATVGATLPAMEIKQAKVRGIDSQGMLCSALELGLESTQSGLLILPDSAPTGMCVREYLDLNDQLITIKLTPNRADCLSLLGIARELSALTRTPLNKPKSISVPITHKDSRSIVLDEPSACPRYCGRIIRDVNAKAATPEWLKRRIERSGIRSISSLVDITNYVMLEVGQPLHAFDNNKLAGTIRIRFSKSGERLTALNEQVVPLPINTLMVADDSASIAIAGVMGGLASAISDATKDVFLESAFFSPHAIVGKAREMGISSDASHRFERGVDFELSRQAIERASELILQICGGESGPIVEALVPPELPQRKSIRLRPNRVAKVLGIEITKDPIGTMLKGLGLLVEPLGNELAVTPPSFRFDLAIEEDLIEEVARIYSYDNIPSMPPVAPMALLPSSENVRDVSQLRRLVAARDYQEVVNFSFVDRAWELDFGVVSPETGPIELANPIASQMSTMRSTLIGGLVGNLVLNRKRRLDRVRIFEIGRCFSREKVSSGNDASYLQPVHLAGLAAGPFISSQWGAETRTVDFFDVKGDIEALFLPLKPSFTKASHQAFHPERCARVTLNGNVVGILGELHPQLSQKYELGTNPILFEITLASLLVTQLSSYRAVSCFPSVIRDLALVVSREQNAGPLLDALRRSESKLVRDVVLFDVYQGKGLLESEKSLAFRVVMQDTQRTLEDAEVDLAIQSLTDIAIRDFNAVLRT